MQNIVNVLRRSHREFRVREVALQELHTGDVVKIRPFSGNQRVRYPHALAAPDEFFDEM
jgi:hypothetical protein